MAGSGRNFSWRSTAAVAVMAQLDMGISRVFLGDHAPGLSCRLVGIYIIYIYIHIIYIYIYIYTIQQMQFCFELGDSGGIFFKFYMASRMPGRHLETFLRLAASS